jgi:hypothetical protein
MVVDISVCPLHNSGLLLSRVERSAITMGADQSGAHSGRGNDLDRAVNSLALGINNLCAAGSLFSNQSKGWVLFYKIAQLPKAVIARVEIGQQL